MSEKINQDLPDVNDTGLEKREEEIKKSMGVTSSSKIGFDTKNYLNTKLKDNEEKRETRVRFLPMLENNNHPYLIIHTHNVRVPESVSPSGWKSYVCIEKTEGIDREKFGEKCPFCETNRKAHKMMKEATDPIDKKRYGDVMKANMTKVTYISRLIERGKESEGVKFWKYNDTFKKNGVYDQLEEIKNIRKTEGLEQGKDVNVFSIKEENGGRDFKVTFFKAATPEPPKIIEVGYPTDIIKDLKTPENTELVKSWIYDSKKWSDVFAIKPYEYLSIIIEGKTPWFDREKKIWVSKEDYDAEHGNIPEGDIDYQEDTFETPLTEKDGSLMGEIMDETEDLPF